MKQKKSNDRSIAVVIFFMDYGYGDDKTFLERSIFFFTFLISGLSLYLLITLVGGVESIANTGDVVS